MMKCLQCHIRPVEKWGLCERCALDEAEALVRENYCVVVPKDIWESIWLESNKLRSDNRDLREKIEEMWLKNTQLECSYKAAIWEREKGKQRWTGM